MDNPMTTSEYVASRGLTNDKSLNNLEVDHCFCTCTDAIVAYDAFLSSVQC